MDVFCVEVLSFCFVVFVAGVEWMLLYLLEVLSGCFVVFVGDVEWIFVTFVGGVECMVCH